MRIAPARSTALAVIAVVVLVLGLVVVGESVRADDGQGDEAAVAAAGTGADDPIVTEATG